MDGRIQNILETLLLNTEVLGDEIMRLARSGQFTPTGACLNLIGRIRDGCLESLRNLNTVERLIQRVAPPDMSGMPGAVILSVEDELPM